MFIKMININKKKPYYQANKGTKEMFQFKGVYV